MNAPYRILVVEDEPIIAEDLKASLEDLGYEVVGICESAELAIKLLHQKTVDLILLDIQLEGSMDGIMLAAILNADFALPFVFLTSNSDDQTLSRLSKTKPAGFLTKPYNEQGLHAAIQLAFKTQTKKGDGLQADDKPDHGFLFVKHKDRFVKVLENQIAYVQAYDNYCFLRTAEEKYLLPHTLKEIENRLNAELFMRLHRSYLVNLNKIDFLDDLGVEVLGERIPMGRSQRKELLNRIRLL